MVREMVEGEKQIDGSKDELRDGGSNGRTLRIDRRETGEEGSGLLYTLQAVRSRGATGYEGARRVGGESGQWMSTTSEFPAKSVATSKTSGCWKGRTDHRFLRGGREEKGRHLPRLFKTSKFTVRDVEEPQSGRNRVENHPELLIARQR